MGIKQRLTKAIAPKVVAKVLDKQDQIISACLVCKNNDQQAVADCKYWAEKKIYRCPIVADLLDSTIQMVKDECLEPAMRTSEAINKKLSTTADALKGLKEKVLRKK